MKTNTKANSEMRENDGQAEWLAGNYHDDIATTPTWVKLFWLALYTGMILAFWLLDSGPPN